MPDHMPRQLGEKQYLPKEDPYKFVPRPEVRNIQNPEDIPFAFHEVNHLLLLTRFQMTPSLISVEPNGVTRARIDIPGHLEGDPLKVVIAGGMVKTPIGEAQFFGTDTIAGSDTAQLKELTQDGEGMSFDESIQTADKLLADVPDDIKVNLAKILLTVRTLATPEEIDAAITAAYLESGKEMIQPNELVDKFVRAINTDTYKASRAANKRTEITEQDDHRIVAYHVTANPDNKQTRVCLYCGGSNTHTTACIGKNMVVISQFPPQNDQKKAA